ncbi:hypothetical protein XELAEV_18012657mg [Xenopus laevis]|uniref:Uncharacterized protein n=1 Tax=Xenopus laevis TaxID=8355 RepID=A0A974DN25_XENLA|nr:hypothetical protein XELAEV_18012657mg [Xenopus laevis]
MQTQFSDAEIDTTQNQTEQMFHLPNLDKQCSLFYSILLKINTDPLLKLGDKLILDIPTVDTSGFQFLHQTYLTPHRLHLMNPNIPDL